MLKDAFIKLRNIYYFLRNISYRSIPNTLRFNFKYFRFRDAIKLPVNVYHRVELKCLEGEVIINSDIKFDMISIGFPFEAEFPDRTTGSLWNVRGKVIFNGPAYINFGSSIVVEPDGELHIGNEVRMSATNIRCRKKIVLGARSIFSWENLFMDTDFHCIAEADDEIPINPDKEIIFGERVWVGCRSTFLKGTKVGNNCIVGANTLLNREIEGDNQIICGNPGKVIKKNVRWF